MRRKVNKPKQELPSAMERIQALPDKTKREILSKLSTEQLAELDYTWEMWARTKQMPPKGHWFVWLICAGRGFGKTRSGAEFVRMMVERGKAKRIALVGRTAADVRDVMIEGESGILACCPPWNRPEYIITKRRLVWPNGAIATTYSSQEPDMLRGPQHDLAWCDELAAWQYDETFDHLKLGLRLGKRPRMCITTTPKPNMLMRQLMKSQGVHITTGSTYENKSNLSNNFFQEVVGRYEGTSLGRQEIYGELLEDLPGSLWRFSTIERHRVSTMPEMRRIVIGVDPAIKSDKDETGIVVCGVGEDGHGYIIADLSCQESPQNWARIAINAFFQYGADRIVAESNQGGMMVEEVIKTANANVPVKSVWATKSKASRAEPISALYEQGRVFHVGIFEELEDQMVTYQPGQRKSPDRLDAMVHAMTELMLKQKAPMDLGQFNWGFGKRDNPWRL